MYEVISPLGFAYNATRCVVRRRGNEHEMVRLRVNGLHNVAAEKALAAGAPITVRFGAGPTDAYSFYGYIDHTEPHSLPQGDYTDVVCLGPTRVMKPKQSRDFFNRTIPSTLGDVFERWQIGFISDVSTQKWAQQSQFNQSDWSFAASLASQVGFTLVPQGAIVRAVDPTRILSWAAPLLVNSFSLFEPIIAGQGSDHTNTVFARQTVTTDDYSIGADPPTILGTPSGAVPQIQHPLLLASPPACLGEAQAFVVGAAKNNAWIHRAKLMMPGDAKLRPGTTIDFQPVDKQYISYKGLWAVLGVDHTLTNSSFVSTLQLGRDTFGTPQVRPPGRALPMSVVNGKSRKLPATVFRANQWVAQWNLRSN